MAKQQQQQINKKIQECEAAISNKKFNIILTWVSFLFTSYHRCIVTIVADKYFQSKSVPISQIEKFKNGGKIINDLQKGLVLSIVQKDKKQFQVRINNEFFDLLPTLIQKMKDKMDPTITSLARLNTTEEIKICQVCKVIKSLKQIQFMGQYCNCDIPSFINFEKDEAKLARLTRLLAMFESVTILHSQINSLNQQIVKLQRLSDKLANRKQTQYELFVAHHGLDQNNDKLVKNQQNLRQAYQSFQRYFTLHNYDQMQNIRTRRQSRLKEEVSRQKNRSPIWQHNIQRYTPSKIQIQQLAKIQQSHLVSKASEDQSLPMEQQQLNREDLVREARRFIKGFNLKERKSYYMKIFNLKMSGSNSSRQQDLQRQTQSVLLQMKSYEQI